MSEKPENPLLLDIEATGFGVSIKANVTLLDLFAAFALTGLRMKAPGFVSEDSSELSLLAYNDAEAMLRERQRRKEKP